MISTSIEVGVVLESEFDDERAGVRAIPGDVDTPDWVQVYWQRENWDGWGGTPEQAEDLARLLVMAAAIARGGDLGPNHKA